MPKKKQHFSFTVAQRKLIRDWLRSAPVKPGKLAAATRSMFRDLGKKFPELRKFPVTAFEAMVYRERRNVVKQNKKALTVTRITGHPEPKAFDSQLAAVARTQDVVPVKAAIRISDKPCVLSPEESAVVLKALTEYKTQQMAALEALGVIRAFEERYDVVVGRDGQVSCRPYVPKKIT